MANKNKESALPIPPKEFAILLGICTFVIVGIAVAGRITTAKRLGKR